MKTRAVYQCQCPICQLEADHPDKIHHHNLNLVLSRSDEQHRRWLTALEAKRLGHGGIKTVSVITGLNEKTISRGQAELEASLLNRPATRIRLGGGGRKLTEKKSHK
jgi:hypothetical protein